MNRRAQLLCAAAALPALLGLTACGQASKDSASGFQGEQRAVAKAVEQLQKDGGARDAQAICSSLLVPELVAKIKAVADKPAANGCKVALRDILTDTDAFELQVKKVTVTGTTAVATVSSEAGKDKRSDTIGLRKIGNAWKIASLGRAA
jgi:hypothetical protein